MCCGCLCACVCVCVCVCVSVCVYVHIRVLVSLRVSVRICVYTTHLIACMHTKSYELLWQADSLWWPTTCFSSGVAKPAIWTHNVHIPRLIWWGRGLIVTINGRNATAIKKFVRDKPQTVPFFMPCSNRFSVFLNDTCAQHILAEPWFPWFSWYAGFVLASLSWHA
jgi:hypothetical protein